MENPILQSIFNHRSVRKFDPEFIIPKEQMELIIKAGQQASTSCTGQMYTIIEITKSERQHLCGKQRFIAEASYFGIICVDLHRLHRIVELSDGKNPDWATTGLMIGIFDAGLFGQNIALAAESLGFDICFCGSCGDRPGEIITSLELPEYVLPLTGIAIGKGMEKPPIRPRLPLELIHHQGKYKKYTDNELKHGIKLMSEKLDDEGYYKKYTGRENFTWRDHIKNKFGGKWLTRVEKKRLKYLESQKFIK